MNKEIYAKYTDKNYATQELENIGFDSSYVHHAQKKNNYRTIKIFNLRPQEASILKQSALALGFDAAVNRGVLDCSIEFSDALLSGSVIQFEKLVNSLGAQPFRMKKVACEIEKLVNLKLSPIRLGSKFFDWTKPYIMGILNITPDSLSDGGQFNTVDSAINRIEQLIKDGADIVDIGAESTRPVHEVIGYEVEIERLKPILKEVRNRFPEVVISLDTRNVKTAEFALEQGANLINDVGFDGLNEEMVAFVNANKVPYIYTHNLKVAGSIVDCVYSQILESMQKITAPVIADVGIGFGKNIEQNYELINRCGEFISLGVPVLVGHSRKSFLTKTFDFSAEELDDATAFVSAKLLMNGVNILRVHDVKRHKLLVDVFSKF